MQNKVKNAQIKNNDILLAIKSATKMDFYEDSLPTKLAQEVHAVIDVTPQKNRTCNVLKGATLTNGTSTTIHTASATLNTYITGATLAVIKDVTSTSIVSQVNVTVGGVSVSILRLGGLSLTPQTDSIAISFPTPILVDKGTTVTLTNSTSVANCTSSATLMGYTTDDTVYNIQNPVQG